MALVCAIPITATGALSAGSGCVIPVPLELENADAGPTAAPVILSASPDEFSFSNNGGIVLDVGDTRRLGLTIRDPDRQDSLYIRIFVDYDPLNPSNFSSECMVPGPSDSEIRVADCTTSTICTSALADGKTHFMEAMVADREFLDVSDPRAEGQPPFRALPEDAAYSFRAWPGLTCTVP